MRDITTVVFDVETTGLKRRDSIIQASFIISKGYKIIDVVSEYIYTDKPIPKEASDIHGITKDILIEKAWKIDGKYADIGDLYEKVLGKLDGQSGVLWIGHNVSFDKGMMESNLAEVDYPDIADFGADIEDIGFMNEGMTMNLCTMKTFWRTCGGGRGRISNIKLHKFAVDKIGMTEDRFNKQFETLCNSFKIPTDRLMAHDSLYDSFTTLTSFWILSDFTTKWA